MEYKTAEELKGCPPGTLVMRVDGAVYVKRLAADNFRELMSESDEQLTAGVRYMLIDEALAVSLRDALVGSADRCNTDERERLLRAALGIEIARDLRRRYDEHSGYDKHTPEEPVDNTLSVDEVERFFDEHNLNLEDD